MPAESKIGKPATRAELHAVEKRLDAKIDRVALELVKTQADVREIKETMSTKDDISRVLSAIDAFARQSERADRAMLLHGQALTEHSVQLKDHDKRMVSLESSRS